MTDKAKTKKASWKLVGNIARYLGIEKVEADYDLSKIFADYASLTEAQQKIVQYGVKQKLADSIAGIGKGATDVMKIAEMTETFDRLVAGEWNKASTERAKLITEAEFMAQAKENNVPDEMAKMMWDLARTAQK